MSPSIANDLRRLKQFAKRAWWLGLFLGLACHFLPPEYQEACRAVVHACTP